MKYMRTLDKIFGILHYLGSHSKQSAKYKRVEELFKKRHMPTLYKAYELGIIKEKY